VGSPLSTHCPGTLLFSRETCYISSVLLQMACSFFLALGRLALDESGENVGLVLHSDTNPRHFLARSSSRKRLLPYDIPKMGYDDNC